ncbi:putative alpha-methylacyl-CoA racemase [Nostocoides japonicum T1-X7]|uniref:Putative alpha-methylacyl-CoA racemase n=1 Tax=Nostocoides japonicum T1-X7 TaxID=1194083 RepID=A0A077M278_9MICO|nr:CaiB/BaiF CoA-transferase family protein [Tetrasphaera japonica]CCH79147.1 putative alpha-methylacyl-CoA racemase [Tetrasphaera japonica T1-X7]
MTDPPTTEPIGSARGLPLSGITVVSCEQAVAAPLATRHLADLGARVIKIERPDTGDFARDYDQTVHGMSSHFVWLNRSKESVTLDLKHPVAGQVMHRLIDTADVFVQNLAPSAAERLGLGADRLRATRPGLVACAISGYGADGPYRDAKAYDLLIQSETGLVAITGTADAPAKAGIPVADIAAGMYAYSGILAALYDRTRTGHGATLEVSLFDALLEWMGYPLAYAMHGGTAPQRTGTSHAAIAPYGTYRAGDGTAVVLSIQNHREWVAFCDDVLRRPDLASDARFATGAARVAHRADLEDHIVEALAPLTGDQLQQRLGAAGIAFAQQRELADVASHPQLTARDRWTQVASPVGELPALRPPVITAGQTLRMDPIPALGEHTTAVLAELGYTADQILDLAEGRS